MDPFAAKDFKCDGEFCLFDQFINKHHLLHHLKHRIQTKVMYQQTVDDPHLLPERSDFIDVELRNMFASAIEKKSPMIFLPNSVLEKDEWDNAKRCFVYKLYLFGIIPDGSKTCVIIDDIEVYFDIMVPEDRLHDFGDILSGMLINNKLSFTKIENVQLSNLRGFQKTTRLWKRIFFNNLGDRKKALDAITERNNEMINVGKPVWETASDDCKRDMIYYFPKMAREQCIKTCDWNRVSNYTFDTNNKTQNCAYTFRTTLDNFKKLSREDQKKYNDPDHLLTKKRLLDKNRTLTMMWDIETYSRVEKGEAPKSTDDINSYTLFMMCSSYNWFYSTNELLDVCIVDTVANPRKDIGLIIECGSEINVLLAHMEVMHRMNPDIIGAFNGACFDWPLYKAKLAHYKLLVRLKQKLSSIPLQTGKYEDTEDRKSVV